MTFRPNPKPAAKVKSPRAMKGKPKPAHVPSIEEVVLRAKSGKIDKTEIKKLTAAKKLGAKIKAIGEKHGQTKGDLIKIMLSTPGGATSKELEAATGWQSHSVRGFLGTLRKSGVNVTSTKLPKEPTIYRIEAADAAGEVL